MINDDLGTLLLYNLLYSLVIGIHIYNDIYNI